MPIYRVRWEEVKSLVVNAEDEEHARHLAYDFWYDKATLEEQGEVGIYEVDGCNGDEQIWSDNSNDTGYKTLKADNYMVRLKDHS